MGTAGKIERGQAVAASPVLILAAASAAGGNHKRKTSQRSLFYSDRDVACRFVGVRARHALSIGERWLDGRSKGALIRTRSRLPEDAVRVQRDIGGDVRQFRHVYQLAGCACAFATALYEAQEHKRRRGVYFAR
jgi:hypothetical protein